VCTSLSFSVRNDIVERELLTLRFFFFLTIAICQLIFIQTYDMIYTSIFCSGIAIKGM